MSRMRWLGVAGVALLGVGICVLMFRVGNSSGHPAESSAEPAASQPSPAAASATKGQPAPVAQKQVPRVISLPKETNPALLAFLDPRTTGSRVPVDIAQRIPAITAPEEVNAVVAMLSDKEDHDTERNEAIELLRRSRYPELTTLLTKLLEDMDERPRFRSFLAQQLGAQLDSDSNDISQKIIRDRLTLGLTDKQPGVRRESLLALVSVKDDRGVALVRDGLNRPEWHADRDLIIRCHGVLGLRQAAPQIRSLAYDKDSSVRIAALYVLGQWRDEASRPLFEEAIASSVPRIKNAGTVALAALDGQPLGPPEPPKALEDQPTDAQN